MHRAALGGFLLLAGLGVAGGQNLARRPSHDRSSDSQNNCYDNGQVYRINQQWERTYLGRVMQCTCHGAGRGWSCESKPDVEEMCFDQYTKSRHQVGDTWERPKEGMIWDCTCIGASRGRISCTIANRCHEGGQSYKIGDTWQRPHEMGDHMLECVCLGNGKGEWTCKPIAERCYDNVARTTHIVGEIWERPYQGWMMIECTCLGEGQGRITCSSRNHCNDQETRMSYRIGDSWTKRDRWGHLLNCTCFGKGRGQWECERRTSVMSIVDVDAARTHQAYPVVYKSQCVSNGDILYSDGMQWIKMQGNTRMVCTCLGNGVSCQELSTQTYGGNSNGEPCVFPFTFMGKTFHSCTTEGREDGKYWCSTTADFGKDKSYSYCSQMASSLIQTRGGNSNGALCQFPYLYNRRNYTECTSDGRKDGMKWCGTTPNYDADGKFGFCPMAEHEEVCTTSEGIMYHIGDQWDKRHDLGHMMRCTCNGNGRGEWSCIAYTQLRDQCVVDGVTYNVNQKFHKVHEQGHQMNCTCFGQERGRWKCDAIDQCQDTETGQFYQIGESFQKFINGVHYLCYCHGRGIGEWTCDPQKTYPGTGLVQVVVTEMGNLTDSHPIQWNAPESSHIRHYILHWRPKNSRIQWASATIPGNMHSYTISGLRPGLTYEGQLISILHNDKRDIIKFEFTTSLATSSPHNQESEETDVKSRITETSAAESITEITSNSLVVSWSSASDTVSGFRIKYELSEDDAQPQYLDVSSSATSVSIPNLLPGRKYIVNVYEISNGGEKLILTKTPTTAPDTPAKYSVDEVDETSITISWSSPQAPITGYRVVYTPSVEGASTEIILPSTTTNLTLTDLHPGVLYNISIYSVEENQESVPLVIQKTTLGEPHPVVMKPPTSLQFLDVTETKITITWTPPIGRITGYRVTVQPLDRRGQQPIQQPTPRNNYIEVTNLLPGTTYRFRVYAVYQETESRPLVGDKVTKLDAPTNLDFRNVTDTSVLVTWTPPRGKMTEYVLSWKPTTSQKLNSLKLRPFVTRRQLTKLTPGTEYVVTLTANQGDLQSSRVQRILTTLEAVGPVPNFNTKVTDTDIVISWKPVPRVSFKVKVWPSQGGETPREITTDSGSILFTSLTPGTDYTISITVVVDDEEQEMPVIKNVVTQVSPPTDLQVHSDSISGALTLAWKEGSTPDITGYRVSCTPKQGQHGNLVEEFVEPGHTSWTLENLSPGIDYEVNVYTIKDKKESAPVSTVITQAVPPPTNLRFTHMGPDTMRVTWSAPPSVDLSNFLVRYSPLEEQDNPTNLTIAPSDHMVVLTDLQPGTNFLVKVYSVIDDRESIPLTGSQRTGMDSPTGIHFSDVTTNSFVVHWTRPRVPVTGFTVKIQPEKGGISKIERVPATYTSHLLPNLKPDSEYVVSIYATNGQRRSLPLVGQQSTISDSPTKLEFTRSTPNSLTIRWTPPPVTVKFYRIVYGETGSSRPMKEISVVGEDSTATITNLRPGTQYTVTVYAVTRRGDSPETSKPVTGTERTEIDSPTQLKVNEVKDHSLTIRWSPPRTPVKNYKVTSTLKDGSGPVITRTVPAGQNQLTIEGLLPSVEYLVSVYAVGEYGESAPLTETAVTATSDHPPVLDFIDVEPNSIRLAWPRPQKPVTAYRVTYSSPEDGTHELKPAPGAKDRSVELTGLHPGTEYTVRVYPQINGRERPPLIGKQTTAVPPPTNLEFVQVTPTSMTISWHAPAAQLTGYRVVMKPREKQGPSQQLTRGPLNTSATISGLMVATKYDIFVYALKGTLTSQPLQGIKATLDDVSSPRRILITGVTETTITLQWQTRSEFITGFQIDAVPSGGRGTVQRNVGSDIRSFTITGLAPGTEYKINIYALSGNSRSPPAFVMARTAIDPPTNLRFISVTESSIMFTWQRPRSQITGYLITYHPKGGQTLKLKPQPSALAQEAIITGLKPGTEYVINIKALQYSLQSEVLTGSKRTSGLDRGPKAPKKQPGNYNRQPYQPLEGTTVHEEEEGEKEDLPTFYGTVPTMPTHQHQVEVVEHRRQPLGPRPHPTGAEALQAHTVSWTPDPDAIEYLVTCSPMNHEGQTLQVRVPGSSSYAVLPGLVFGEQYNVIVESLNRDRKKKIMEETITAGHPSPDHCYDVSTNSYYAVGQEWERLSDIGLKMMCTCSGLDSGYVKCDSSKWCHDNGKSYKVGEKWNQRSENGQMVSCTCLGNNKGEYKCEPDEASCFDEGNMYNVGEQWQKEYLGAICSCTCLGGHQGWRCDNCRQPKPNLTGDRTSPSQHGQPTTVHKPKYVHCPVECGGPRDVLADSYSLLESGSGQPNHSHGRQTSGAARHSLCALSQLYHACVLRPTL